MSNEVMNIWKSKLSEILLLTFFFLYSENTIFFYFFFLFLILSLFFIEYSLGKKEQSSSIHGEFI